MADKTAIRMYRNERARHLNASVNALAQIAEASERLLKRCVDGGKPDTSELRHIVSLAQEARARAEAFDAVDQLEFLITEEGGGSG